MQTHIHMDVCMQTRKYIYIQMQTDTVISTYIHVCTKKNKHIQTQTHRISMHTHVHRDRHTYIHIDINIDECAHTSIPRCTHTNTHRNRQEYTQKQTFVKVRKLTYKWLVSCGSQLLVLAYFDPKVSRSQGRSPKGNTLTSRQQFEE